MASLNHSLQLLIDKEKRKGNLAILTSKQYPSDILLLNKNAIFENTLLINLLFMSFKIKFRLNFTQEALLE